MGYYGSFEFDVTISAMKVADCSRALRSWHKSLANYETTSIEPHEDLVNLLRNIFDEAEVYLTEDIPALKQLALAGADHPSHGDLKLVGHSHQKWRGYIDETFSIIAPYTLAGSEVNVTGEEGEQCRWRFDGAEVDYEAAQLVWSEDRRQFSRAESALNEIVGLLDTGATFDCKRIIREWRPDLVDGVAE